jgi:hypothetical protein
MDKKNAELTVKIIAILGYIGIAFAIVAGLMVLFLGRGIGYMYPAGMTLAGTRAVVTSILMIAVAIVAIFVLNAFWHHKNWARIVFVIFSALAIISSLTHLPRGIIGLVINAAILYFLAFDKSIVHLFK